MMAFNSASLCFDKSPVVLIVSNNFGWFAFTCAKNLDSNLEISDVRTLSKNPLTPA